MVCPHLLIYAVYGACITAGSALAGAIQGGILDLVGYVAKTAQTIQTLEGMLFAAFLVPGIVLILTFMLQSFFGIDDKKRDEFVLEIAARDLKINQGQAGTQ